MNIRKTVTEDLNAVVKIYENAKNMVFERKNGKKWKRWKDWLIKWIELV